MMGEIPKSAGHTGVMSTPAFDRQSPHPTPRTTPDNGAKSAGSDPRNGSRREPGATQPGHNHQETNQLGQQGKRSSRVRWKVPVLIVMGTLLSAVLAAINGLQLASLKRALGGLPVPESQFGGYDAGYVELVRERMTDELLERYGASHYLWDLLFPLVFTATIILLISHIGAGRKASWLLMNPPVLFAAVDIAENLTLEALFNGPDVMASEVALASTLTVIKTVLLVMSIAAALSALLIRPRPRPDEDA